LEQLAYYLVRLGTYAAKWAARAAKGEVGKQLSLGGAVAMETARNFVGGSLVYARVREEIDVPDPATGELLIRVPAPVDYFPFTGWKDSFFGGLHATGRDGVEFYTERKVVIERWQ
jgi:malonate-semialdehyde dehydrogenase (acetylating) / methylmalonate-semialdehyde dehydrogenase